MMMMSRPISSTQRTRERWSRDRPLAPIHPWTRNFFFSPFYIFETVSSSTTTCARIFRFLFLSHTWYRLNDRRNLLDLSNGIGWGWTKLSIPALSSQLNMTSNNWLALCIRIRRSMFNTCSNSFWERRKRRNNNPWGKSLAFTLKCRKELLSMPSCTFEIHQTRAFDGNCFRVSFVHEAIRCEIERFSRHFEMTLERFATAKFNFRLDRQTVLPCAETLRRWKSFDTTIRRSVENGRSWTLLEHWTSLGVGEWNERCNGIAFFSDQSSSLYPKRSDIAQ